MISSIFGSENSYPNTTTTNYIQPSTTLLTSWNATLTNRVQIIPGTFTISNLYVLLDTAPTSGKSWQFDVMKNGSTTGVTVTISDSAVTAEDTTNSVSFSAGDTISLRSVPSGTPTAGTNIWWNMKVDGTGTPLMGSSTVNASASATNSSSPMGVHNAFRTTLADADIIVPTSGTFSNLYVSLSGTPGAGKSYVFELYKNSSATGLTVTISGTATTANDTTHTFTVTAGDRIHFRSTPSGTPSARVPSFGLKFTPDTSGESFIGYG